MFGLTTRNGLNNLWSMDPFKELEEMQRAFFAPSTNAGGFGTDIIDDGNQYRLEADLPGFKKEDIHVDVNGDRLTISAERKNESEDNKDGYIRRERSYGSYSRTFDISQINADAITGDYSDGVLKLVLPKKEEAQPTARRIELH